MNRCNEALFIRENIYRDIDFYVDSEIHLINIENKLFCIDLMIIKFYHLRFLRRRKGTHPQT